MQAINNFGMLKVVNIMIIINTDICNATAAVSLLEIDQMAIRSSASHHLSTWDLRFELIHILINQLGLQK